ncbi:unnamed protein product [Enterobius vermicularis]|uniref:DUF4200 domain-containing protein n=1 Tax=Enterobius vermicularis TaxID=51028 RepID=A0A0N4V9F2_ENTVE|nr:unnamed protein product [Enterobius vermicularis]
MNREKEREDAKRRDIFLHISDAELLGDLPVDGQVNKALYDEVKKKQDLLRQLKSKVEKELERRDKLEEELAKVSEERNSLKRQSELNAKLLEDEEHLARITEAEKKRVLKELIEAKIKLYDKKDKVKNLKNICESQRTILQASPYVEFSAYLRLIKILALANSRPKDGSTNHAKELSAISAKKAMEQENKSIAVETEEVQKLQEKFQNHLSEIEKKRSDIWAQIEIVNRDLKEQENKADKAKKEYLKIKDLEQQEKIKNNKNKEKMEKILQRLSEAEKEVTSLDNEVKAYEHHWEELQDVLSKADSDILSVIAIKTKEEKKNESIERKLSDLESDMS